MTATTALEPGARGVLTRTVEAGHCTRRGEYDIFSTPNLVLLLEEAAMTADTPSGTGGGPDSGPAATPDRAPADPFTDTPVAPRTAADSPTPEESRGRP